MMDLLGAAVFTASLFLVFKVFGKRRIPVLPAIIVNYFVAFTIGFLVFPFSTSVLVENVLVPAVVLGLAFITMFSLTAVSTQRAGVAATTIACKMSLVLTVALSIHLYEGTPSWLQMIGIALAIGSVVLASWKPARGGGRELWLFPLILFLSNAFIDSFINHAQKVWLSSETMTIFPTITFFIAGTFGLVWIMIQRDMQKFRTPSVWGGGAVLGVLNFAALYFIIKALSDSGLPGSSVFPLVNIGVVFFAAMGALLLFKEKLSKINWVGISVGVGALFLILLAEQDQ